MGLLRELAEKNRPRKGCPGSSMLDMIDVYEQLFAARRMQVKTIVEIGVESGNSLRLWRDYFPNAQVWGLDRDAGAVHQQGERIKVLVGGQQNIPFLQDVCEKVGPIDIVIDDASKVIVWTLTSFRLLYPRVVEGGVYILEDSICTYDPKHYAHASPLGSQDRAQFDFHLRTHIWDIDHRTGLTGKLEIHPNMVVFHRRVTPVAQKAAPPIMQATSPGVLPGDPSK